MNLPLAETLLPLATESPRAHWASVIIASWRKSVEAIFATGRALIDAQAALPYGEWSKLFEPGPGGHREMPFSLRFAQMLQAIAEDPRLTETNRASLLPPHPTIIYKLHERDDETLERWFADGTINPEMRRTDVLVIDGEAEETQAAPRIAGEMSDAEAGAGDAEHGPAPADRNVKDREREPELPLPNGARSMMSSRQEPDDSLDFFPTPPWATRALMEHVMPALGIGVFESAWEPACGEGHIAEVLREYFDDVEITDIHDYGYRPEHFTQADFAEFEDAGDGIDWIVTNPPFGAKGEEFARQAIGLATVGVAMFFRLQFLETVGRYDDLFKPHPPALIAQFVERCPLHKGRWEPEGDTATSYVWIVWLRNRTLASADRTRFFWIPPGCRESLTKDDDVERFTQHPVRALPDAKIKRRVAAEPGTLDPAVVLADAQVVAPTQPPAVSSPEPRFPAAESAELAAAQDDLEIPDFLRRNEKNEVPA